MREETHLSNPDFGVLTFWVTIVVWRKGTVQWLNVIVSFFCFSGCQESEE